MALAGPPLGATDRVLVNVFLSGGNDGLNTVVPFNDGNYQSNRTGPLRVNVDPAHSLGQGLYFNPNLSRLKARFDAGQVAVIRGVGEPTDDHSHFTSMATWMSGGQGGANPTGWLGRYVDGLGLDGLAAVNVGMGQRAPHFARRGFGGDGIANHRQPVRLRPVGVVGALCVQLAQGPAF